jgi:hypothetical protein
MFSVQHKTSKGWRLWRHLSEICLKNVELKVYESGRKRVIKEQKKNVHAYIIGDLVGNCGFVGGGKKRPISYNPYKCKQFHFKDEESYLPITKALAVHGWVESNKQPILKAYL